MPEIQAQLSLEAQGGDPMKDFETFTDGLGDWKPALSKHFDSMTFRSLYKFLQNEYET